MERLTLEKFKDKYYPHLSQRALGRLMGISDKEYTVIKQQTATRTSDCFKKAASWMHDMHRVILTYDSPGYAAEQKYEKKYKDIIRQKDKRIMELEQQVQDLKAELAFRDDFAKCVKYIKRNC